MLTLDQHFASGYLPSLTGAYFNLVQLVRQSAESPSPEVRAAVAEEVPRLKETAARVRRRVERVEGLALAAGFTPPHPPRMPDDYFAWFEAVYAGFRCNIDAHGLEDLIHTVGHRVGDILCSWNVALMTLRLLMAEPGSALLEEQWIALVEDIHESKSALEHAADRTRTPRELRRLAGRFAGAVAEAFEDPLDTHDRAAVTEMAEELQATMHQLWSAVEDAEASLGRSAARA